MRFSTPLVTAYFISRYYARLECHSYTAQTQPRTRLGLSNIRFSKWVFCTLFINAKSGVF